MSKGYDLAPFVVDAINSEKPIDSGPVDTAEVPMNDPNARLGYGKANPYSAGCQQGRVIAWLPVTFQQAHIAEDGFTTGFDGKPDVVPPDFKDHEADWEIAYAAGKQACAFVDMDKAKVALKIPQLITVDPRVGHYIDPWSDPEYLQDVHSPAFPYHNKRQQMISLLAFQEGAEANSRAEIPDCPGLFVDNSHYWKTAAIAGYLSTHDEGVQKVVSWVIGFVINEFLTPEGKADIASILLKLGFFPVLMTAWSYISPWFMHAIGAV